MPFVLRRHGLLCRNAVRPEEARLLRRLEGLLKIINKIFNNPSRRVLRTLLRANGYFVPMTAISLIQSYLLLAVALVFGL
jgi:hypothetical protein